MSIPQYIIADKAYNLWVLLTFEYEAPSHAIAEPTKERSFSQLLTERCDSEDCPYENGLVAEAISMYSNCVDSFTEMSSAVEELRELADKALDMLWNQISYEDLMAFEELAILALTNKSMLINIKNFKKPFA